MSDRELLEMAAKAIGKCLNRYTWQHNAYWVFAGDATHYWNPLTDDGDALRLAVDLQLCTSTGELACAASWPPHSAWLHEIVEKHDGDKRSAMRRAITRAAAEIGRQME